MSSAPDFSPIQHITVHFLFFHHPTHKIKVVKVAPPEQTQAVTRSQQAEPLRVTQRMSMNYLHHPAVSVSVSMSVKYVCVCVCEVCVSTPVGEHQLRESSLLVFKGGE